MSGSMNIWGCCGCCSENPPDKWLNTPTVPVSQVGGGFFDFPAAMQPFESCDIGLTGGCGKPINWRDFCGAQYDPALVNSNAIPCGTNAGPSVMGTNNFTLNPDYPGDPYPKHCVHPGFKNVQAIAQWPGRFGFLIGPACCPTGSSSQTKYRTITRVNSASWGWSVEENTYNDDGSLKETMTSSGNQSRNESTNSTVDIYGNKVANTFSESSCKGLSRREGFGDSPFVSIIDTDIKDGCGQEAWNYTQFGSGSAPENEYDLDFINLGPFWSFWSVDSTCGNITIDWIYPLPTYDPFRGTADDFNALNIFTRDETLPAYREIEDPGVQLFKEWRTSINLKPLAVHTISDTLIDISGSGGGDFKQEIWGWNAATEAYDILKRRTTRSYTFEVQYRTELSSPYTWQQVCDDAKLLLSFWNLGDNEAYPWRQDGAVWLAPLVSRDAASTGPDIDPLPCPDSTPFSSFVTSDLTDGIWTFRGERPSAPRTFVEGNYTGHVIGAPQEVGKARYFNFTQDVEEPCCGVGLVIRENNWFCNSGWGEYSPAALPKTATQWTDMKLGSLLFEGTYILQLGPGVMMQKWAETLAAWPSPNLARPFGRDRFLVDFTAITDDPDCSGDAGIAVTSYAEKDICADPASFLYAHRKFPGCRTIGSAIVVASAVQTTPESSPGAGDGVITITTSEKHWLVAGGSFLTPDVVDFYSVAGLGGGVTLLSAAPGTTTFTVTGTLAGSYTGGGYITSPGMTADVAKWDWTCPRHQFVVQQWDVNARAYGAYDPDLPGFTQPTFRYSESQVVLDPKAGMSVLLCSPNKEVFPDNNAVYEAPFGEITSEICSLYFDSDNIGNRWNSKFIQAVADPHFIAPTKCTASDGKFCITQFCSEGDPECTYAHFALVEPMLQLPPGAPAQQIDFPYSFYGSPPFRLAVNCQPPRSVTPTMAIYNAAYLACGAGDSGITWKEVTHHKCSAAPRLQLALASGYMPPPGSGTTPPEENENVTGAGGDDTSSAGDYGTTGGPL